MAAWDEQKRSAIVNCWAKSGMVPTSGSSSSSSSSDARVEQTSNMLAAKAKHLDSLISRLGLGTDALTADDYTELPGEEQVEEELCMDDLVHIATVNHVAMSTP